ncbi:hypothetical protein TCON_1704 [Astathelohania contejeani]|uniref:Rab-GAP TBC domain-containing protein n=1 Tax=Astathelohania contejeani TaxID=164912 RepID=A0ABQ7HY45_9MICR|nr:hypothetical protein TCON_1704 [Thelohania contejeani]
MTKFSIDEIMKNYSIPKKDRDSYKCKGKSEKEIHVIISDVDRSFQFLSDEFEFKKNIFKYILTKILIKMKKDYVQGMSEIGSVIVFYYFNDLIDQKNKKKEKIEEENTESKENEDMSTQTSEEKSLNSSEDKSTQEDKKTNTQTDEDKFSKRSKNKLHKKKSKNIDYSEYVDKKIFDKALITLYNIITEKYEPMIVNDFKMYLEYNSVFIRMMSKRNKLIKPDESLRFMNTTLTWFIRSLTSINDIYTIFGYILSCPTSFTFLLLVKYYDLIVLNEDINSLDDDLYEQLIKLEKEFLKTEFEMKQPKYKISKKMGALVFGSVVIIGLGVLYKIKKGDDG